MKARFHKKQRFQSEVAPLENLSSYIHESLLLLRTKWERIDWDGFRTCNSSE